MHDSFFSSLSSYSYFIWKTFKMTYKWVLCHLRVESQIQSLPRFIIRVQCNVQSGNPVPTAFEPPGHRPLTAEVIHVVESLFSFWQLKSLSTKKRGKATTFSLVGFYWFFCCQTVMKMVTKGLSTRGEWSEIIESANIPGGKDHVEVEGCESREHLHHESHHPLVTSMKYV